MAILLLGALGMVALGLMALGPWLDPQVHPARFFLFWFGCGWLTLTALLLALLDLLIVRAEARRLSKTLSDDAVKRDDSGE